MKINKFQYEIIGEIKRQYVESSTLKIKENLNMTFKAPVTDSDTTGIYGKYLKRQGLYRIKYIHSRNNQLQPQTYDRYYYLVEIGEDEKGSYIEYAMVHDKLYDPLIRIVYLFVSLAACAYLYYMYISKILSSSAAGVLGAVILLTVLVTFKKSKESADKVQPAENIIEKLFENMC